MSRKILIVEDESLIAFDLSLILEEAGYSIAGIADSVSDALALVEEEGPDMVLLDIFLKGSKNGIYLAGLLTERHIPFVYLSANFQESILEKAKETQPYGFLVKPFREKELLIALDVAFYRHQNSIESKLRKEKELAAALDQIMASAAAPEKLILSIASALQPHIPFDFMAVCVRSAGAGVQGVTDLYRTGFSEYRIVPPAEMLKLAGLGPDELHKLYEGVGLKAVPEIFAGIQFDSVMTEVLRVGVIARHYRMQSLLNIPLLRANGDMLILRFYSRREDTYTNAHLDLFDRLRRSMLMVFEQLISGHAPGPGLLVARAVTERQSKQVKKNGFEGIIGRSHQMLKVFDLISIVAPQDTSVLILGESGTGKERIARSIHSLSARNDKPLIVVNCASIPANLIESELFGHEKGAFTGALERRTGKFEMADKGTIFLDEIGEMGGELQMKLLRVLQEQEIERIGGKGTIPINVRIIAATNRNLEREVEEGRFRLDLYYRLFVFPVILPSLYERRDDIPILAEHFLCRYAEKTGKKISGIAPQVMTQMMSYSWPGNVRELEHFIERSVLLSAGPVISDVTLPRLRLQKQEQTEKIPENTMKSIEDNARDHIIRVLKNCNGRISGPGGAADILDIPPTTLHSKLKRLGINKDEFGFH